MRTLWFSFSSLPPGQGARVYFEFCCKRLLPETSRFAIVHQLLRHSVTLREGNEAEKFNHLSHMVNPRSAISLLPSDQRHLIAADYFGHLDLLEVEVETPFADFLAQGFWSGRIALLLCSIRSPWATQPT